MKYSINKEFFPYSCFAPPIRNAKMAGWMGSMMKPPRRIWRDQEVAVELNETKGTMHGYDIVEKAPTTKATLAVRIRYMQNAFYEQHTKKI